ncbi:MAG: TonB-dependent receptor [Bryobacterales bacterium]|nr:TonB-dependent receptor [Bryobacterales bacterium]
MQLRTLAALLALAWLAPAQESRGTLRGRVLDPTGAAVAGARVEVVNTETNVRTASATNAEGNYEAPYLLSGTYRVTVEQSGFKKSTRDGIEVRINDRITLDFTLELGAVGESVTVKGDTVLLETATASVGQVVDSRRITELPIAGGNAYHLARFQPGIVATGGHAPGNPTQDLANGALVVNGTRTGNSEALVDGVPNNANNSSTYMVPPQDMVEEFRVQTSTYDASAGRAAGAIINLTTKAGTNQFHGTAYYLDSRTRAVPWFSNRWLYDPATGPITPEKRQQANPGWLYLRWGGTASGPVHIPKVYDGRNKTFWSFGYEGMKVQRQATAIATFPTAAQKQGDFSQLLALGASYQIYDPRSGALQPSGRVQRQPVAGNRIPASQLDPIAVNMMKFFPEPNVAGDREGRQNYFRIEDEKWRYKSVAARLDHNFSDRWRAFTRVSTSEFDQKVRSYPTEAVGTWNNPGGYRVALDNVYTFSPTALLNVRYGLVVQRPYSAPLHRGFDLASLGFSADFINQLRSSTDYSGVSFPALTVDGYTALGAGGGSLSTNYSHTIGTTFTKIQGNHSWRAGQEYRLLRDNGFAYGNVAPALTFGTNYTRGPLDTSAGAPIGQGLASLLYGIPTGGQVNVNASRAEQSSFQALFFQDDWRLTSRLTVNMGIRWEYESPVTERFNRSIRGFSLTQSHPMEAQAKANYATNPIPQIAASRFAVRGGLTFAGVNGEPRTLWSGDKNNFMPRIGLAYQLNAMTVIRAGYGIFYTPSGADRGDVNQGGFSQSTLIVPTLNNGVTFNATLARPFPNGIDQPAGASQGVNTFLGRGVSYFNPAPLGAYMQRWSLNVQRQLPGRMVLEIGYVGNRGTKLQTSRALGGIPNEFLSTSPLRDQPAINLLNDQVRNPFAGITGFAGTGLAGAQVARSQLLRPYPHFTGVGVTTNDGFSFYNAMTINVEKRFSHGLLFQTNWTWSKFMEAISYLNDGDARPAYTISDLDFTHRFNLTGIYELPFGTGKPLLGGASRWMDRVIGGWQLQASYEGQSGNPLGFGNAIFNGDLADVVLPVADRRAERWFNTEAGFERRAAFQLASNVRRFPLRFSGIRGDGINNVDASLMKRFRVTERVSAQLRLEAINAANHVQFADPNTTPTNAAFGSITGEKGHGQRQINLFLKVIF